jgi:lambda repressor-like predicted transcriptional regulator
MASRLTDEYKQYMLRRYREGAALRQIARETGRPDITVKRTLQALGVEFGAPKTTSKRSSPEIEALVVRLYDEGCTWAEIAAQADVTGNTIAKILGRNGRDFGRRGTTEGKEDLIAALYKSGESTRAIGEMLGLGKSTVNNVVAETGGTLRIPPGCEYPDYFEHVDTPEKAYWLGFLSGDGCIITTARHPDGDRVDTQLGIRDKVHLDKLRAALGASALVRTGARPRPGRPPLWRAMLNISSRRLVLSLVALGVTPRKTGTLEPWAGPAELMPHYWRGLVDANGSLAHKTKGLWTVFLCGSEPCVRAFAEWAHGICGTNAEPFFASGCWRIGVAGRHQVPALVSALYRDALVSLDRKQERAALIMAGP